MRYDLSGRYWAKVKDVVPGSRVKTDLGSDCWYDEHQTVHDDGRHGLYILCREGHHYLEGQIEGDHYIGIYQIK